MTTVRIRLSSLANGVHKGKRLVCRVLGTGDGGLVYEADGIKEGDQVSQRPGLYAAFTLGRKCEETFHAVGQGEDGSPVYGRMDYDNTLKAAALLGAGRRWDDLAQKLFRRRLR